MEVVEAAVIIAFVIWSIVAIIFVLIGISAWRSKQEVGFFSFSKPVKMRDIVKYNHAVGKLWVSFAAILEFIGIPFLFAEQNSPIFIFILLEVMVLVIAVIIIYLKIEEKYREQ